MDIRQNITPQQRQLLSSALDKAEFINQILERCDNNNLQDMDTVSLFAVFRCLKLIGEIFNPNEKGKGQWMRGKFKIPGYALNDIRNGLMHNYLNLVNNKNSCFSYSPDYPMATNLLQSLHSILPCLIGNIEYTLNKKDTSNDMNSEPLNQIINLVNNPFVINDFNIINSANLKIILSHIDMIQYIGNVSKFSDNDSFDDKFQKTKLIYTIDHCNEIIAMALCALDQTVANELVRFFPSENQLVLNQRLTEIRSNRRTTSHERGIYTIGIDNQYMSSSIEHSIFCLSIYSSVSQSLNHFSHLEVSQCLLKINQSRYYYNNKFDDYKESIKKFNSQLNNFIKNPGLLPLMELPYLEMDIGNVKISLSPDQYKSLLQSWKNEIVTTDNQYQCPVLGLFSLIHTCESNIYNLSQVIEDQKNMYGDGINYYYYEEEEDAADIGKKRDRESFDDTDDSKRYKNIDYNLLNNEIENLNSIILEKENTINNYKLNINELNNELATNKQLIEKQGEQIQEKDSMISKLKQELNEKNEKINRLTTAEKYNNISATKNTDEKDSYNPDESQDQNKFNV